MGRQISVSEAAERLGVTSHRVRQRIKDGSLPAERVGNRWGIDEADLLPLLDGAKVGRPLSELVAELPEPTLIHRRLACPWAKKGLVMRVLNERLAGRDLDLTDGIKLLDERGWSQVLPDPDEPLVHLYAEGETSQISEELEHEVRELVEEIMQGDAAAPRTSVEASS